MGKTSKTSNKRNKNDDGFKCSNCVTMVYDNRVTCRGLCKPCRRDVLLKQLEEMNRAEWKETGGSAIDGEINVLLAAIAEKRKRGFVEKEIVLDDYRKSDSSDSSDGDSSSSSSESSDGEYVPVDEEVVCSSDEGWKVNRKRGSMKVKRVVKSVVRERADKGKVERVGKKSYADAVSSSGDGGGREPSRGSG